MRARVATGVEGLDDILHGGLPPGHLYLVTGPPGSGKTTLGLQFLLEGARADAAQSCAYVALSESARDLREIAESHGWDLGRIEIADLTGRNAASRSSDYTFFHPAEIELGETMEALMEAVDRISPTRLVVDSLSELRMLARDPLRYRRHLLELKHEIGSRDITTLLLDVSEGGAETYPVESIVHGVVRLEQRAPLASAARTPC